MRFLLVAFVLGAMALPWAAPGALGQGAVSEPKLTGKVMLGKMAFVKYCAQCHGDKGQGTDKGPTFLHRVYHPGHHADQAFFLAAKNGARAHHWKFGNMKPVEGINDAQLANVVKYVRALQKANGIF